MAILKTGEQVYFKGIGFPFTFDGTGAVSQVKYSEADFTLIKQSLANIILTGIGEAVAMRDYGCSITGLIFDTDDDTLNLLIQNSIVSAVSVYEPRVELTDIQVYKDAEGSEDVTRVRVEYKVLALDTTDSTEVTM